MRSTIWLHVAGAAALMLGATGCGSDGSEVTVPTAEELAASLVTTEDFAGEWAVNEPPTEPATWSSFRSS